MKIVITYIVVFFSVSPLFAKDRQAQRLEHYRMANVVLSNGTINSSQLLDNLYDGKSGTVSARLLFALMKDREQAKKLSQNYDRIIDIFLRADNVSQVSLSFLIAAMGESSFSLQALSRLSNFKDGRTNEGMADRDLANARMLTANALKILAKKEPDIAYQTLGLITLEQLREEFDILIHSWQKKEIPYNIYQDLSKLVYVEGVGTGLEVVDLVKKLSPRHPNLVPVLASELGKSLKSVNAQLEQAADKWKLPEPYEKTVQPLRDATLSLIDLAYYTLVEFSELKVRSIPDMALALNDIVDALNEIDEEDLTYKRRLPFAYKDSLYERVPFLSLRSKIEAAISVEHGIDAQIYPVLYSRVWRGQLIDLDKLRRYVNSVPVSSGVVSQILELLEMADDSQRTEVGRALLLPRFSPLRNDILVRLAAFEERSKQHRDREFGALVRQIYTQLNYSECFTNAARASGLFGNSFKGSSLSN